MPSVIMSTMNFSFAQPALPEIALIGNTQYRDLYATLLGLGVTCPVGWLGAWAQG